MTVRFEDLRVRDKQPLDADFFNRRFRLIAEQIATLSSQAETAQGVVDEIVRLGLARINEILTPALARVQAASELGFLLATSSTSIQLSANLETTFALDDTEANHLFTPTPYVTFMRDADDAQDDWAVARVQEFNAENLGLAVKILVINGTLDDAAHDDWVISASPATVAVLADQIAAAQTAAAAAQQAAIDVAAAALLIAEGPVSSVNGQTGAVSLAMGDIPNLLTTLAGKATAVHSHGISDIQNLASSLDAKAGTVHTHSIAAVEGLQSALDAKAASTHSHDDLYNTKTEITNYLNQKANISSPAFTGTPTAPTAAGNVNTDQIATMAAVQAAIQLVIEQFGGERTFQ